MIRTSEEIREAQRAGDPRRVLRLRLRLGSIGRLGTSRPIDPYSSYSSSCSYYPSS